MWFVCQQLVRVKLLFFSLLGQPVDLLLGELRKTAKKIKLIFQKQKFTTQRCCCPLEETTEVTTVFLKLQTTLYSVLPGKIQKKGISTEGSHATGCAMLHQLKPQPRRSKIPVAVVPGSTGGLSSVAGMFPCAIPTLRGSCRCFSPGPSRALASPSCAPPARGGTEEGLTRDLDSLAVPLLLQDCVGALQAGVAPPQLLADEAIEDVEADEEQDKVGDGDPEHGGQQAGFHGLWGGLALAGEVGVVVGLLHADQEEGGAGREEGEGPEDANDSLHPALGDDHLGLEGEADDEVALHGEGGDVEDGAVGAALAEVVGEVAQQLPEDPGRERQRR